MSLVISEIGYEGMSHTPLRRGSFYFYNIRLNVYFSGTLTPKSSEKIYNFGINNICELSDYFHLERKYKLQCRLILKNNPEAYINNLIDICSDNGKLILAMWSDNKFLSEFAKLFVDVFETIDKQNLIFRTF